MMKKIVLPLLFAMSFVIALGAEPFSSAKGVWANDNAEAVITDEVCIYFAKGDSAMQAILEIPAADIFHKTTFEKDGTVTTSTFKNPLELELKDGNLNIAGEELKKVEDIEIVEPYEMAECKYQIEVGKRLQEWRLGVRHETEGEMPYCEINTNRHMFIYMVSPAMVYIRAAATRNNNAGTLFFQNIRMMKNLNTGEYTMSIHPGNYSIAKNDLVIDNSRFNPNACTFCPDGSIYWSLISYDPDVIMLNGCGETYQVPRPTKDFPLTEWIKYVPYDGKAEFSVQRMMDAYKTIGTPTDLSRGK